MVISMDKGEDTYLTLLDVSVTMLHYTILLTNILSVGNI